ncbi:MAG: hypothetical protein ACK559_39395, partial [bacterium]
YIFPSSTGKPCVLNHSAIFRPSSSVGITQKAAPGSFSAGSAKIASRNFKPECRGTLLPVAAR